MELARTVASRAPLVVGVIKKELCHLSDFMHLRPDEFEEIEEQRRKAYWSADLR